MKKNLTLVLFICLGLTSWAQNITLFKSIDGDTTRRRIVRSLTTSKGDLVHLCEIEKAGNTDFSLVKVTPNGNILWQKVMGSAGTDGPNNFIQLKDGGFALVGYTSETSATSDGGDMFIIKTDSLGVPQWAKQFGGAGFEEAFGVTELNSGDIFVLGKTASFSALSSHAVIGKFTANGELMWQKNYMFGKLGNYFFKGFQNGDTEILVCGYTYDGTTGFDPVFVRVTEEGAIVSTSRHKINNFQIIYDWVRDADGSIYWAGTTTATAASSQNVIGKVSPEGTAVWTKYFGTPRYDKAWDMVILDNKELLISGYVNKTASDQSGRNGFIARISPDGVFKEAMEFGSNSLSNTEFTGLAVSGNQAYATGLTYNGANYGAGISVQFNSLRFSESCNGIPLTMSTVDQNTTYSDVDTVFDGGDVSEPNIDFRDDDQVTQTICDVGIKELSKAENIYFYPNPSRGIYKAKFPTGEMRKISIYQANGSKVFTKIMMDQDVEINLEKYPSGLFKVLISTEKEIYQTTIIKQ